MTTTINSVLMESMKLTECEMSVQETMKVLTHNQIIFFSWGVSKLINVNDKGLLFKVSGRLHKGWVLVVLTVMDLYKVHIISNRGEIKETIDGLYFDQLVEVIDRRVETKP